MFDFIAWIIVGALSGWIGSIIMKTDKKMGPLANIIAGILGAFVGGFVMRNLFNAQIDPNGISIPSILTAIVGAIIVIGIYKLISGKK